MGGLGILGGTFNPPHDGHLACARHAYRELDLGRVLFMPVHVPPHKRGEDDPGAEHRLTMCRLATEGDYRLLVSSIEVERDGPSYTVDTLRAIHASDPGVELTFIVGADMARTLLAWREPEQVLALARMAIAERKGETQAEVLDALAPLAAAERVCFLRMPPVDVSSSLVRARVAAGEPIDDLVPAAVVGYIAEHGLYGSRRAPQMGSAARAGSPSRAGSP